MLDELEECLRGTKGHHLCLLDAPICYAVGANQLVYVAWAITEIREGWSLCILPVEMPEPDSEPAGFVFVCLPENFLDLSSRNKQDKAYRSGYYSKL